jgi:hypothetical protein
MQRKLTFTALITLIAALTLSVSVLAGSPCCKGKAMKSANQKGCMMKAAGCPHHAEMQEAFKALESDLAALEKGVPAADQEAFMKAHQAHLKKLLETRAQCMKGCKAKMEAKESAKS